MNGIIVHVIGVSLLIFPMLLMAFFVYLRRVRVPDDHVLVVYGPSHYDAEYTVPFTGSRDPGDTDTVRFYRGGLRSVLPVVDGSVMFQMPSHVFEIGLTMVDSSGEFIKAIGRVELALGNEKAHARDAASWLLDTNAGEQREILEAIIHGKLIYCGWHLPGEKLLGEKDEFLRVFQNQLEAGIDNLGFVVKELRIGFDG